MTTINWTQNCQNLVNILHSNPQLKEAATKAFVLDYSAETEEAFEKIFPEEYSIMMQCLLDFCGATPTELCEDALTITIMNKI